MDCKGKTNYHFAKSSEKFIGDIFTDKQCPFWSSKDTQAIFILLWTYRLSDAFVDLALFALVCSVVCRRNSITAVESC